MSAHVEASLQGQIANTGAMDFYEQQKHEATTGTIQENRDSVSEDSMRKG